MQTLSTSVLIPSFQRPAALKNCLAGLAAQTIVPTEVLVVWQVDDTPTYHALLDLQPTLPYPLVILHNPVAGVVPAENLALAASKGDIIMLIDDDAVAPPDWIDRQLKHYSEPSIGAVGGPSDNTFEGEPGVGKRRSKEPVGRLTWYGRSIGNMWNQVIEWRARSPRFVDHLVGNNMSLRRIAFDRFEDGLMPYWQMFEMDACLQVRQRGFKVLFDFGNVMDHFPRNPVFSPNREGDLSRKIFHPAYNHAYVLASHSAWYARPFQLLYLVVVGTVGSPGLMTFLFAVKRYGNPRREFRILTGSIRSKIAGWQAGAGRRKVRKDR